MNTPLHMYVMTSSQLHVAEIAPKITVEVERVEFASNKH